MGLAALAGGAAATVTLAACYGPGCVGGAGQCSYDLPDFAAPLDFATPPKGDMAKTLDLGKADSDLGETDADVVTDGGASD